MQFSNYFSPKEYNLSKYYAAIIKTLREKTRPEPPASFSYTEWFIQYIRIALNSLDIGIYDIFHVEDAKRNLERNLHQTSEGYWHRFSNIVLIDKLVKYYQVSL